MPANVLKPQKVLFADPSFRLTGILFRVRNELGPFAREKKYGDKIASYLKEASVKFEREKSLGNSGNIADFLIDGKIVLELKGQRTLTRGDFDQVQRYLQESGFKLGVLVNFRNQYLKPYRVVRIDR